MDGVERLLDSVHMLWNLNNIKQIFSRDGRFNTFYMHVRIIFTGFTHLTVHTRRYRDANIQGQADRTGQTGTNRQTHRHRRSQRQTNTLTQRDRLSSLIYSRIHYILPFLNEKLSTLSNPTRILCVRTEITSSDMSPSVLVIHLSSVGVRGRCVDSSTIWAL